MMKSEVFKVKYYSSENIRKCNATYNIIFGERSNGKTFDILGGKDGIIWNYVKKGEKGAILRRFHEDIVGKKGDMFFRPIVQEGIVYQYSEGQWTDVYHRGGQFWLCRYDEGLDTIVKDTEPFCYSYAISQMEHDKGGTDQKITTVLFDEFLTRNVYLKDEFVLFQNVLSTIIRQRSDVKIFMLGNTVSQYCPYFKEMGLTKIKNMHQGDIDVYSYGNSKLKVAVEFADSPSKKGKPSDFYFAFDNPRLQMITGGNGTGSIWEMDIYPHLPFDYTSKDILFTYFILFDGETYQAELIQKNGSVITYIHRKTTELRQPDKDLIFSKQSDPRPNWRQSLTKPTDPISQKVIRFFAEGKVFYQDNEVGEAIRNFLIQK
jgi:hypothetical protein